MLTIKNWGKLIGESFLDDRFRCTNFLETETHLRFWFRDLEDKLHDGGVWVEIEREGKYDSEAGHNLHTVTYPHCHTHKIGVHWFGDMDNAKWTFEEALKKQ